MAEYIQIKRKHLWRVVWAWFVLFVLIVGSFQYTNYVFSQLCGLVSISDQVYKEAPPTSATGQALAKEFDRIDHKYHC